MHKLGQFECHLGTQAGQLLAEHLSRVVQAGFDGAYWAVKDIANVLQ